MGFLVGNDFIPPLPDMHIISGALPTLYKAYIDVLPTLGGELQRVGPINFVSLSLPIFYCKLKYVNICREHY
jgi:5'-3' exoribonuclease 1